MDEGCKNDRELETQGSDNLKVEDSMSMEWTDEKHSLYLNSMEASFVDLLYRNKYHLKDIHGLPSRTRKHTNSLGVDAKTVSSGQFKVLRRGCWEKLNFEKVAAESHNDTESEAHLLSANPWIQHFRPSSIGKELHVPSYNLMDVNDSSTQHINLSNQNNERVATSSVQFPCFSRISHQDSVGCCTEVSDQNFVDQEPGGEKLSITYRKKKAKTAATKEPFKDQVVPLGKLHIGSTCEGNHSPLK